MGCDIHVVVEQRDAEGEPWRLVAVPRDVDNELGGRNYTTFGVLAGVREDMPQIADLRGFPEDADVKTTYHPYYTNVLEDARLHGRFLGDHSHSWVTLAELNAYDWGQSYQGRYAYGPDWTISDATNVDGWLPWLRTVNPDPANVRIVFGFDS